MATEPLAESGALRRPSDLGEVTLAAGPELPSTARAAVSGWLDGRVPPRVVVDALASKWGVTHLGGTQVWFSLPLPLEP